MNTGDHDEHDDPTGDTPGPSHDGRDVPSAVPLPRPDLYSAARTGGPADGPVRASDGPPAPRPGDAPSPAPYDALVGILGVVDPQLIAPHRLTAAAARHLDELPATLLVAYLLDGEVVAVDRDGVALFAVELVDVLRIDESALGAYLASTTTADLSGIEYDDPPIGDEVYARTNDGAEHVVPRALVVTRGADSSH